MQAADQNEGLLEDAPNLRKEGAMPGFKEFKKVLPAANMPMLADMSIDEETYRKHLRWLMTFDIGGLVISGHAGELESLTPKERIRVFRYGAKTGLMYSVEVLLKIAEKVPQVVAIKDSSFDYESAWVAFQNFPRKINFIVAHGSLFLIRFATSDGAISSFSNVVPEYITELFRLAHSGQMEAATKLFNKIRPLSDAIYHKQPLMQHWVVEKEALVARGRFPRAVVRPPFQPLKPEHIEGIRAAVAAAGLAPLA